MLAYNTEYYTANVCNHSCNLFLLCYFLFFTKIGNFTIWTIILNHYYPDTHFFTSTLPSPPQQEATVRNWVYFRLVMIYLLGSLEWLLHHHPRGHSSLGRNSRCRCYPHRHLHWFGWTDDSRNSHLAVPDTSLCTAKILLYNNYYIKYTAVL